MLHTDVVIVGAGQAGLAVSCELAGLGIDHVILERGRVAERWRSNTWESLRLLTPNWMTRLPGWHYRGPDPDGFMPRDAVVKFFAAYAGATAAPVVAETPVRRISRSGGRFVVETPHGSWRSGAVVIATGHCELPSWPEGAIGLSRHILQIHSSQYRRPGALPTGNVLVVGASPSGVQIAQELALSGRTVTLSVGRHTAVPRRILGRDIFWWLDRMGALNQAASAITDIDAARRQPSLQLAGRQDGRSTGLAELASGGIRLVGRFLGADDRRVTLADDLEGTVRAAERKRDRLVGEIVEFARYNHMTSQATTTPITPPIELGASSSQLDLADNAVSTVIWATGFRRNFSWVDLPVVLADGDLIHTDGITPIPGLYALGFRFMRKRNSSFIDGVGGDAAFIAHRIAAQFGHAGITKRIVA